MPPHAATADRITLSVAMIIKNEADHLPHFVENVAPLADEICVLDTGSADGSLQLAHDLGCVTGELTWCDDFAAARNASLELCSGGWILVLDADERVAEEDRTAIRALAADVNAGERRCYRFITRNYTHAAHLAEYTPCAAGDPHAHGFPGWFPSGKVRLFPNHAGAAFSGYVHELVNPSLEALGFEVITSPVPIHHYPLERPEARVTAKRNMYLALARRRAAEQPDDPRAQVVLAEQCVEAGDLAGAVAAYHRAAQLEPREASHLCELGAVLLMAGKRAEARRAMELALRLDETKPAAWRNLGVLLAQEDDWAGAAECFERATALAPEDSESWRFLGVARRQTGEMPGAREAAARAVAANPVSEQALALVVELGEQGDAAAWAKQVLERAAKDTGAEAPREALRQLARN